MESDATLMEWKIRHSRREFYDVSEWFTMGTVKCHVCLDNLNRNREFIRSWKVPLRDRSRSQHVEFDRTLIPCVFTVTSKIFHFVDLDSDPLSRLLSTAPLCTYAVKALPR